MADNNLTSAVAGDDAGASTADQIPVTASEAKAIETAETINAANAAVEKSATEPAQSSEPEKAPEPDKKVQRAPGWAERKIEEEAFKRREEARQRKAAEERAAKAEAELEAFRRGNAAPNQNATANSPAPPEPQPLDRRDFASKDEFDRAVADEADRRARISDFNRQCNSVFEQGKAANADFPEAVQNLQRLGAMTPDNLDILLAFEQDAHRLIYDLGSNPDEADRIFKLPPARLAAELGKKAASLAAPKAPVPISKAPPPVKPIDGAAKVSSEPLDTDDDNEWFRKRMAQRTASRAR